MSNERGWKKGDIVVSKPDADFAFMMKLKYLADSELDYGCFIGEDINGDVSDDWLIDDFEKECD